MLLTGQNLACKTGVWGALKVISCAKLMLTELSVYIALLVGTWHHQLGGQGAHFISFIP